MTPGLAHPCRSLAQCRTDLAATLRTAPLTVPARERLAAMLRGLDALLGEQSKAAK